MNEVIKWKRDYKTIENNENNKTIKTQWKIKTK